MSTNESMFNKLFNKNEKNELDPYCNALTITTFEKRAKSIISAANPDEYMLISFEIDQFSAIIDICGREMLTPLLTHVTDTINPIVEQLEGIICHVTGSLFIILAKNMPFSDLEEGFYNLKKKTIDQIVKNDYIAHLALNVSAGVYYIQTAKSHLYQYIEYAEMAKALKKNEYGSTLVEFTPEMLRKQKEVTVVSTKMQNALKRREFFPYIQPKVSLSTGEPTGGEVLVRWISQDEMISPGTFIPVMESNGFIASLDLYMFEETCKVWRMLIKTRVKTIKTLSVNLSRLTLLQPNLTESLQAILTRYDLQPHMIELEVTESAFIGNKKFINDKIKSLSALGFLIAIDDFGTNYSTLISLLEIDAHTVKFDREFINSLITQKGKTFVASMIITFQNANFHIVFEGIETKEQHDIIADFGCDTAQGFYYAKPLPLEDFLVYSSR